MTLPSKKFAYHLQIYSYLSLIAFITAWIVVISPPQTFPISLVLIVCVLPLLLPMRGVLHGRDTSSNWATYLSLLYLMHGISEVYAAPDTRWLGAIEIVLSSLLFSSSSLLLNRLKKDKSAQY